MFVSPHSYYTNIRSKNNRENSDFVNRPEKKFFSENLPYSNSLSSIADIILAIGSRNGKIYSEAGNSINPDQTHYFVLELETYGEVIIVTAKGSIVLSTLQHR